MISPAEQKIIQIELTNFCPHSCGNCTRFCGHHKRPFFMEFGTFRQAVESLASFPRMVGIMGGEPTLHPKFDAMMRFFADNRPDISADNDRYLPMKSFISYRNRRLGSTDTMRGLWTSLGKGYYKHHELIQDVFRYQCINDHSNTGKHLALMLPRKELRISNAKWKRYRDNCWLQREWSASITPKGAFFCEVAAAYDMLFDGPGGWAIEPGWWLRQPKDFGKQLDWCEMCSACLPAPAIEASIGLDLVSPKMYQKLKKLGSGKVKKGKVTVFPVAKYREEHYQSNSVVEPYLPPEGSSARADPTNKTIRPQHITALMVCVGYDDYLDLTLPFTIKEVDRCVVITDKFDKNTPKVCTKHGVECFVSKRLNPVGPGRVFYKGRGINDCLNSIRKKADWVLATDADIVFQLGLGKKIKSYVLNPGALYYVKRWGPENYEDIPQFIADMKNATGKQLYLKYASKEFARVEGRKGNAVECFPFGYFQLFHPFASTVINREYIYPEKSSTAEYDDKIFGFETYKGKTAPLPQEEFEVIHLPHGNYRENWKGRISPRIETLSKKVENSFTFTQKNVIYRCKERCTFRNRLWEVGEKLTCEDKDVPHHFERTQ